MLQHQYLFGAEVLVDEIKTTVWHTDRPLEPITLHNHTNVMDAKTY